MILADAAGWAIGIFFAAFFGGIFLFIVGAVIHEETNFFPWLEDKLFNRDERKLERERARWLLELELRERELAIQERERKLLDAYIESS
jgi:hypothetical protein